MAAQGFADGGGPDRHVKVEQFALDPLVASAGILNSKPDDRLPHGSSSDNARLHGGDPVGWKGHRTGWTRWAAP
jgi:hypothetical protein